MTKSNSRKRGPQRKTPGPRAGAGQQGPRPKQPGRRDGKQGGPPAPAVGREPIAAKDDDVADYVEIEIAELDDEHERITQRTTRPDDVDATTR